MEEFVKNYSAKYHATPGLYAGLGYQAGRQIWAKELRAEKSASLPAGDAAILSPSKERVAGTAMVIRFDKEEDARVYPTR